MTKINLSKNKILQEKIYHSFLREPSWKESKSQNQHIQISFSQHSRMIWIRIRLIKNNCDSFISGTIQQNEVNLCFDTLSACFQSEILIYSLGTFVLLLIITIQTVKLNGKINQQRSIY